MYGAAVLAHAMELFGIEEVHARDRDGLDGYMQYVAEHLL